MNQSEPEDYRPRVSQGDLVFWNLEGGGGPTWIGPLLVVDSEVDPLWQVRFNLWDPESRDFFWALDYEVCPIDELDQEDAIGCP